MVINVWKLDVENNTFDMLASLDMASSVIWIERYQDYGQFELYISAEPEWVDMFTDGDIFLTKAGSERGMYVETIKLTEDEESGNYLTITGRSAELMMLWRAMPFSNFQDSEQFGRYTAERIIRDVMERWLINDSVIFTNDDAIDFLSIEASHGWEDYTERQFTGKTVYQVVQDLCSSFQYGFKFVWTGSGFEFQLYKGIDRSFDQTENSYVIFSPDFNNLTSSEYLRDSSDYYNSAIVAGQGEGLDRVLVFCYPQDITGFKRRTIWADARQSAGEGNTYKAQLKAQGDAVISEHRKLESFVGEVFTEGSFKYGTDYKLGDKVAVENNYGIRGSARVVEITEVEDAEGYRLIPTLSEWTILPTEEEDNE